MACSKRASIVTMGLQALAQPCWNPRWVILPKGLSLWGNRQRVGLDEERVRDPMGRAPERHPFPAVADFPSGAFSDNRSDFGPWI